MTFEKTNCLPVTDPRHHAMNISHALRELAELAREDVEKVNDPCGRALFEMTAETLLGLSMGMDLFVAGSEPAMWLPTVGNSRERVAPEETATVIQA